MKPEAEKCSRCKKPVIYLHDGKCEDCYDAEFSGCYGGGCIGGSGEETE
jgi:hypothetical protein